MECTGAATVIRDCLGAGAPGGIVCLTGVTEPGKTFELDIGRLNRKMVLDTLESDGLTRRYIGGLALNF